MLLFQATGNSTCLKASEYWCLQKGAMSDNFDVLQKLIKGF
jgi:hypothetical protein